MLKKQKLKNECCHCCKDCFKSQSQTHYPTNRCQICFRLGKQICSFNHTHLKQKSKSKSIHRPPRPTTSIKQQIINPQQPNIYQSKRYLSRPSSFSPIRHPVKYSLGPTLAFPAYLHSSYTNIIPTNTNLSVHHNTPSYNYSIRDSYVTQPIQFNINLKFPINQQPYVENMQQVRSVYHPIDQSSLNKNQQSYKTRKSYSTFSNSRLNPNESISNNNNSNSLPLNINDLKKR